MQTKRYGNKIRFDVPFFETEQKNQARIKMEYKYGRNFAFKRIWRKRNLRKYSIIAKKARKQKKNLRYVK